MLLTEKNINLLESIGVPNTYWKNRSEQYLYWFRSLLQKIDSSIIFEGLPEKWSNDFFMLCLWSLGYVAVFGTNRTDLTEKYGNVLFFPCTVSDYDFYYQPKNAVIANQDYYSATLPIGEKCEIIKLTPDCFISGGCLDIIDYYASKLAEISKGIDIGLINAKMPLIFSASNESQAETLKKVYDKVQAGESLVIWKDIVDNGEIIPRKDPFENWCNDYQKTYIVNNLLEDMEKILNSFYIEIGLPVAIEKKERIITSEADFASAQSQARISTWLETLRESLTKVNAMFNLNITCEVAFNERENNPNRSGNTSTRTD